MSVLFLCIESIDKSSKWNRMQLIPLYKWRKARARDNILLYSFKHAFNQKNKKTSFLHWKSWMFYSWRL